MSSEALVRCCSTVGARHAAASCAEQRRFGVGRPAFVCRRACLAERGRQRLGERGVAQVVVAGVGLRDNVVHALAEALLDVD